MELEYLIRQCNRALYISHSKILELGEKGRDEDQGEDIIVTKGDNEVSKVLGDYLMKHIPTAIVQSEEGGNLNSLEDPEFLVTFDEIDGTFNYHRGVLPYCTIVTAIKYSEAPKFEDVLFGGILEHTTEELCYAIKDQGCFTHKMKEFNTRSVNISKREKLDEISELTVKKVYASIAIDLGPDAGEELQKRVIKTREKTWVRNISCAGEHLKGVASGNFDGYICFAQKAHELGAGYRLIKEAGGDIWDMNGISIGNQEYHFDRTYEIVAVPNHKFGRELLSTING